MFEQLILSKNPQFDLFSPILRFSMFECLNKQNNTNGKNDESMSNDYLHKTAAAFLSA